jgi:hypothetical protein
MGITIKRKTVFMFSILVIANIALWVTHDCSEIRNDPCPIPDQIKFLDTAMLNEKEYVLVELTTGWHEKTFYLELFTGDVIFDYCGKANIQPIFSEELKYGPYDQTAIQWPEKIEIKNKQILIHYTKDEKKSKWLVDVPVIWHQN